jgi:hypothetical protein
VPPPSCKVSLNITDHENQPVGYMIWQSANDIHCDVWNARLCCRILVRNQGTGRSSRLSRFVFWKCSVRISAGPKTMFHQFLPSKFRDSTSNRPPPLPFKYFPTTRRHTVKLLTALLNNPKKHLSVQSDETAFKPIIFQYGLIL